MVRWWEKDRLHELDVSPKAARESMHVHLSHSAHIMKFSRKFHSNGPAKELSLWNTHGKCDGGWGCRQKLDENLAFFGIFIFLVCAIRVRWSRALLIALPYYYPSSDEWCSDALMAWLNESKRCCWMLKWCQQIMSRHVVRGSWVFESIVISRRVGRVAKMSHAPQPHHRQSFQRCKAY